MPPALELRKTAYNDGTLRWKKPLTSRPRSKEGQTGVSNPLQASPDNSRTPPFRFLHHFPVVLPWTTILNLWAFGDLEKLSYSMVVPVLDVLSVLCPA